MNDFVKFGRTYQVIVSGDARSRAKAEDVLALSVRNDAGQMVPFGAFAEIVLPDAGGAAVLENGEPLPPTEAPLVRGSGRWTYSYVPNGATIHRRVPGEQRPPY